MESICRMIFSSFKLPFPMVKADEGEELVDPQVVLRDECGQSHCSALQTKYETCNQRVNSKKNTTETCSEELVDFMHCVDHCVAKTLFTKLK